MKTSISLFFVLFAIAWFDVRPCSGDDFPDEFEACGVYYNCGDLVNITYPFWGNERQKICGRQNFELNCKGNETTTIVINDHEFVVLNINQSDSRMRIARWDLLDDYCPDNDAIQTAALDARLFNYSSNDRNISVWFGCLLQRGSVWEEFMFECGGDDQFRMVNYAFEAEEKKNLSSYDDSIKCRVKMEVTVRVEVLSEEGKRNRTALVEKGLREGFDVEYGDWYPAGCEECNLSGGTCGTNSTHPFYCNCANGGDKHPYFCTPLLPEKSSVWKKVAIIGSTALGSIILIIIISIKFTRKGISNNDIIEEIIRTYPTQTPKRYSYSKLKKITNSFNNKLGQGGFSTVYRGKLPGGHDVAVKLLNEFRDNGQDFINEVVSITRASHINVVTLLGFCYEGNKRALIYEYMPKGSLDKYISPRELKKNNVELKWNTLYNIVIGVARGLEYLHRGCNTRILHFDIKPHNILLDNDFCPKISDFGLAKQCRAKESHVSMTGVKGTVGFIAPEVIFRNFGKVSHKSDVYSYGMLVLEMVGERKNPNEGMGESSEEYFPDWIYKNLREDERNGGRGWSNTEEEEEEMARKMIIVGLHCIQTIPDNRPSMTDVVVMLEGSVDALQIPPKPNMFGPPATEQPQLCSSSLSKSY